MTDQTRHRSARDVGRAMVIEVRRTERGDHEVSLDAQFDGDPFLITLRRRSDWIVDLAPGRLVTIHRLASGEIVVAPPDGTCVLGGGEPV